MPHSCRRRRESTPHFATDNGKAPRFVVAVVADREELGEDAVVRSFAPPPPFFLSSSPPLIHLFLSFFYLLLIIAFKKLRLIVIDSFLFVRDVGIIHGDG